MLTTEIILIVSVAVIVILSLRLMDLRHKIKINERDYEIEYKQLHLIITRHNEQKAELKDQLDEKTKELEKLENQLQKFNDLHKKLLLEVLEKSRERKEKTEKVKESLHKMDSKAVLIAQLDIDRNEEGQGTICFKDSEQPNISFTGYEPFIGAENIQLVDGFHHSTPILEILWNVNKEGDRGRLSRIELDPVEKTVKLLSTKVVRL